MSSDLKSNFPQNNRTLAAPSSPVVYEFEDFQLDADHLMLYRNGDEVPLTPKQVETLLALVEKGGEIVSKNELMARLWGDASVEESNLLQNIYVLRRVLGSTADDQPLVETFRRRGYRLSAKVQRRNGHFGPLDEVETSEASVVADAGRSAPFALRKRAVTLIVLLLLSSGAALTGYVAYSSRTASKTKVFAVLPLRPIDESNRNVFYEIGAADALINRMNSIEGLSVRPLSSTRNYSDIAQDPLAVGRELKVGYVVTSNYQLADGKVRITTQIYDVATGRVEETFPFEKEASGVFSTQEAFAADVGNRLMARFNVRQKIKPRGRGTENQEAYRLYLQAMNLSDEPGEQNSTKALGYLENAVALDPNYAPAWAGIALLHCDLLYAELGAREHYEKSMDAIGKALAIDANNSDAYSALCHTKNRYEYDAAGADTACRRAIELDPDSPQARKTFSNFLFSRGRFDEAVAEIKAAIELQPVSFRNQQVYALSLFYARRYSEAEKQFKRLRELNPNRAFTYGWLAEVLDAQGRHAEAFDSLINKLTLEKADPAIIEQVKNAYAASGWNGVTAERIKNPAALNIPGSFQLACLYAKIGDKDRAFENLEKAYQARSYALAVLEVAPQLDPLRDDPRYADLVRRVFNHQDGI